MIGPTLPTQYLRIRATSLAGWDFLAQDPMVSTRSPCIEMNDGIVVFVQIRCIKLEFGEGRGNAV